MARRVRITACLALAWFVVGVAGCGPAGPEVGTRDEQQVKQTEDAMKKFNKTK